MKKFALIAAIAAFTSSAMAADDAVMEKYNKSCAACHATGAAGAPKTGDADAWASRLEKGSEALVASVANGMGAMPPKGMCYDCSNEDYAALIEYMAAAQ
jgi:cytochrome c5